MKRQRGRNRNGGAAPSGAKTSQNANRAFDSNGPENVKVRGHAQHVYEKYQQLARDAFSASDRVLAENYLQHAEHYFRTLRVLQPNRPVTEIVGRDVFASGFDLDFEDEALESAMERADAGAAAQAEAAGGSDGEGEADGSLRQDAGRQDTGRQDSGRQDNQNRQNGDRYRDRYERQGQDRQNGDRSYGENRAPDRNFGDRDFRSDRQNQDRQNQDRQPQDRQPVSQGERPARDFGDRQNNDRQNNDRQNNDRDQNRSRRDREDRFRNDNRLEGAQAPSQGSGPNAGQGYGERNDRPEREPRRFERTERSDPLAVIEPQAGSFSPAAETVREAPAREPEGSPILRSIDGSVSEAPAFLSAPSSVPVPDGETARAPRAPRTRRRRVDPDAQNEGAPEPDLPELV